MKKIVIVIADGRAESVFVDANEEVEIEIADFDESFDDPDLQNDLAHYVDMCRETMKEIKC